MSLTYNRKIMDEIREAYRAWGKALDEAFAVRPERLKRFSTVSDQEIKRIYTPQDVANQDFIRDIGFPGQYPFTRGVQPSMYRGRLWTMRMFAGLGSAKDTNRRFHLLVKEGETGLSVAFDMPTLMGYDTFSPRARGECGKCGVAIDTLKDMEDLFEGLPIDKITTSMTINPPAPVIWAMYIAMAEKRGVKREALGGTIQNDMLKEFIAQKTFMCPPKPSLRLITDTVEFGTEQVPKWNTISISGYHIREAGSTAVQELAFTLADGIAYTEAAIERGLDVDRFAPRFSFFFNSHMDFFEEVAKFRAARRMWAKIMKERFKAKNPRSWWMRFHTQTAGCSLTAQQPYNNIVRTALEALAAVLGGTQSLHTNSLDEVLALPSEEAATIALRTQQIIAEESGVANTIDPLGGSFFVEALTDRMEEEAFEIIKKIDDMGGMLAAVEKSYPQKEIADSAYRYQKQIDENEKVVVGVNKYITEETLPVEILEINEALEKYQIEKTEKIKNERDNKKVAECLERLGEACVGSKNVMEPIIDAVKEYATLQEVCDVFRRVFGEYRDPGIY
ncbi:MAG: methylmalonyl-CoA mutase family protein [Deltaproteobacteria bacterium]|nr:methylmalonyl-CoA mutase family protein [Deltaproteobacteria bacterium]MBW1919300.1 methylmalonyl-CoA mutase family protein [Deltaproteobacteria bacterium]MBW1933958.1 methylmalonyl-CoA mutase family protein [Deltaproteobacteria bacterium]MBW1976622.1 methylmalonyl-CoA mutase family protein [Deltaproteobacteria bacterium]MBW2043295.1 methylmalonyl-CoA mutase family protein [Deltaproteobacteria bacterium]